MLRGYTRLLRQISKSGLRTKPVYVSSHRALAVPFQQYGSESRSTIGSSQRMFTTKCPEVSFNKEEETTNVSATSDSTENPTADSAADSAIPVEKIDVDGSLDKHQFQAETRQLLDIVAHSIYTDKEVFIRELVSNASDALEKLRHMQTTEQSILEPELSHEIRIMADDKNMTLTIEDTGVGMSKQELMENLGTIARSGSKSFMEKMKEAPTADSAAAAGIIGKFGVGFYSAFMVADKVEVYSVSAVNQTPECHLWQSNGDGAYEIARTKGSSLKRGTRIVLHLKKAHEDFAKKQRIEKIIKQYSNFVSFPITLNNEKINTVQALWTMDPKTVSEDQYNEFFKFIDNSMDKALYHLHYRTDAPIELKCLLFIAESHSEKYGLARLTPGVSLYSRKVLIERQCKDILPDWCRFVRGVVDSEDLPLSLSREKMQNTRLLARLKDVLTRRVLRFLDNESQKDPEKYIKFFEEHGSFLKEGICTDYQYKDQIAKLLRFESSTEEKQIVSFDDYISRMQQGQDEIYYMQASSREIALQSPYYEAFKKNGKEVLFISTALDDFVMSNLPSYNKRNIVNVEQAQIKDREESKEDTTKLSEADKNELTAWLKLHLDEKVKDIRISERLYDSPVLITEHGTQSMRRMMSMVNRGAPSELMGVGKTVLEINPYHPIILQLNEARKVDSDTAVVIVEQLYDNASMAAGILEDGRKMLPRMNKLISMLLERTNTRKQKENSN